MASLIPLVVAIFHHPTTPRPHSGLGEGGEEFLHALAATHGVQRDIQQAFGVLMGGAGLSAAEAYVALCELAEDAHGSLHDVPSSCSAAPGQREISSWRLLRQGIDSRANHRLSVCRCVHRVPPTPRGGPVSRSGDGHAPDHGSARWRWRMLCSATSAWALRTDPASIRAVAARTTRPLRSRITGSNQRSGTRKPSLRARDPCVRRGERHLRRSDTVSGLDTDHGNP